MLFGIATRLENRAELISLGVGCSLFALVVYPWNRRTRAFSIRDGSIIVTETGEEMPWIKLVDISVDGHRVAPEYAGSGRLRVKFGDRESLLQFSQSQDQLDFYRLAWLRIVDNLEPKLDPLLMKVLVAEQQKHPDGEVLAAGSQGAIVGITVPRRVYLGMLLLALCGFAGAALAQIPTVSITVAVILVILLLAAGLLSLLEKIRYAKSKSSSSGWVMSPTRFALMSKTLSGEMKWSELKGVELKPNGRKPKQLRLKLEGVDINLSEEYQLPLWYLYEKIEAFRSKYSLNPIASDSKEPMPTQSQPFDTSNPYSPPTIQ